jgi:Nif-specific regulatory protein
MRIALFSSSSLPITLIADLLRKYGIELHAEPSEPQVTETAIALVAEPGAQLDLLGDRTTKARRLVGPNGFVIVCAHELVPSDREALRLCGGSAIVRPQEWTAAAIAERALSELIASELVGEPMFGEIRGGTLVMRTIYDQIRVIGPLAEPVLITGETGTGKELVARELHRVSMRQGEIFAVNCAALNRELLGSELFGHERGAFTGAIASRKGLLAEGGRGTVFLDEIGELSIQSQAELLRVIEERAVRPVGANRSVRIEARLIFATNRNLDSACESGVFRRDLYERLRGFTIDLPALRERKPDLGLLARYFVVEYNKNYVAHRHLGPGAEDALFDYDWPGNVRELRQLLRSASAFSAALDGPVSTIHVLESIRRRRKSPSSGNRLSVVFDPLSESWRTVLDRVRHEYFAALVKQTNGDKDDAARRAGISRSQLYEILKSLREPGSRPIDGDGSVS